MNEYANEGLRIIQVEKEDLIYISEIFSQVEKQPYRFIMLCDDLTFEVGELSYKMLKSALDGSVYSAPENVLIYVTSNRRYLLPEYDGDHLGGKYVKGELQQSEIQEEKSSLSDRFGLWVPFHVFSQDRYLEAVKLCIERWSKQFGRDIPWSAELEQAAIKWTHEKPNAAVVPLISFPKTGSASTCSPRVSGDERQNRQVELEVFQCISLWKTSALYLSISLGTSQIALPPTSSEPRLSR